ncbi:MAG: GNAT family N-acetyltransferase [Candidatus Heimdallarchaeota archaeon]|nr:GNAT family N-acetyltransferase [Candidatus Heimdallarchaeota archaeon]MCG3254289.1 GNAT family N-acetyltransferase [Candidatus Heimdallarchaeota archaeon]MCK4291417.1 GNAT family N-acetyltransferase [Candidatus Heimdallarchaeota archaeon]
MSEIIIRLGLEEEYKKIAEVFVASFIEKPIKPERQESISLGFKKIIQKKITTYYVAVENKEIIGIGGETCYGGVSYIGYIGVIPTHRRRGIGSLILGWILEEASKNNPTIDLFSNLGIENLYRKFGFEDEFYTHILELPKFNTEIELKVDTFESKIPSWIYELDKEAMGFDRSKLLDHLVEKQKTSIVSFERNGYAICSSGRIGPMIAKNKQAAKQIFDYLLSSGTKRVITPENFKPFFTQYHPRKIQSTLKMTIGEQIKSIPSWIWSYSSFASS